MSDKGKFLGLVKQLEAEGGHWYIWGAQGPDSFDCSGLVCWCGAEAGLWDKSFDTTADGFWRSYTRIGRRLSEAEPGDLALYGTPKRATHVVVYIGDDMIIGANGGGSKTTSVAKAKAANARVSRKRYDWRKDFLGFVRLPFDANPSPSTDRFPLEEGPKPVKFCHQQKWIMGDGRGFFVNVPLTVAMTNTIFGRAGMSPVLPATSDPRELLTRNALQGWLDTNHPASSIDLFSNGRDPKESLRLISLCYVLYWLKSE